MRAYQQLSDRFHRFLMLRSVEDLLNWDSAVLMPTASGAARGEQLALLRIMGHEALTAKEIGGLLTDAQAEAEAEQLDEWQRANLAEMRREHIHAAAVPARLVTALSHARNRCELRWREARPASDFAAMVEPLGEVLKLVRESGQARAEALDVPLYDALLDEYEPGLTSEQIDAVFEPLGAALPGLIAAVVERQASHPPAAAPPGPFPIEQQQALGRRLMAIVGFDFESGRLDVSAHPFCGGSPDDVRVTTRYDEADFTGALMGILHETGHAMYERGLPKQWRHQPVGRARGMAVHESQSLLVEMQVCRSLPFLEFAAPLMREAFKGSGDVWSASALYRLYTKVEPGFIRVDADEVTYPAHILLRYDLEKRMVAGELQVTDLPTAWDEGMQRLLGLSPPDHRQGCLQDIHWFDGAFGYFPCYTLGAILAAQLFRAACAADPELQPAIGGGDFRPLMQWLRARVHSQGARFPLAALAQEATGRGLDVAGYLAHLRARYLAD